MSQIAIQLRMAQRSDAKTAPWDRLVCPLVPVPFFRRHRHRSVVSSHFGGGTLVCTPVRGSPSSFPWQLQSPKVVLKQRSEEHTSELQSLRHLVCRVLLEKNASSASRGASLCFSPMPPLPGGPSNVR